MGYVSNKHTGFLSFRQFRGVT